MSFAIPIIVITIAAAILIILLAVLLYRRHLDRVVSGEERDLHTKAVEPGAVLRTVLICVLAIWLLISMANISVLKSEVENLSQQVSSQYSWIAAQLEEMDEKLDAQTGLTQDYWFDFKNVDPEKKTMDMELHVLLNEYSGSTAVSVKFGDTVTELKNIGGEFFAQIPVELFTLYETYPVLTAETDGVIRSEELDRCIDGYPGETLLPMLWAGDDVRLEYDKKGNLTASGGMTVFEDSAKIGGLTLQSASVTFELDGEIVKEIPLTFTDGQSEELEVSESFPVAERGQQFYICLKSVNSAGWTVTQRIAYYDWEGGGKVYLGGDFSVADENGALLFQVSVDMD